MDTLINGEIVSVDVESVWAETFAHWDARVPTAVAEQIANATTSILRHAAEPSTTEIVTLVGPA